MVVCFLFSSPNCETLSGGFVLFCFTYLVLLTVPKTLGETCCTATSWMCLIYSKSHSTILFWVQIVLACQVEKQEFLAYSDTIHSAMFEYNL